MGCLAGSRRTLTSGPSDISDTGLSEPLSSSHRKRMHGLMARRRIAATVSEINTDVESFSRELDAAGDVTISAEISRSFDPGSITCVSLSAGVDAPSANCKSEKLSSLAKSRIPSLKRHQNPAAFTQRFWCASAYQDCY